MCCLISPLEATQQQVSRLQRKELRPHRLKTNRDCWEERSLFTRNTYADAYIIYVLYMYISGEVYISKNLVILPRQKSTKHLVQARYFLEVGFHRYAPHGFLIQALTCEVSKKLGHHLVFIISGIHRFTAVASPCWMMSYQV